MAIFGLYIKGNISIYALLVIMVETLFISTLFISVHADATEAIQIIFLTDEEFNRQRREDHHDYNPENIDANLTTQLKDDLANDVKMERKKQKEKREESN
jgi:N-acetylmuramoyl-L-alanine amidase